MLIFDCRKKYNTAKAKSGGEHWPLWSTCGICGKMNAPNTEDSANNHNFVCLHHVMMCGNFSVKQTLFIYETVQGRFDLRWNRS